MLINTFKRDVGINSKNFYFSLCCKDLFNSWLTFNDQFFHHIETSQLICRAFAEEIN